ncbi:MAG: hypothetical protein JNL98_16750 [Bryobacterales bacterium]|nr:hypothetical protein [Bryobacterales bacterium]
MKIVRMMIFAASAMLLQAGGGFWLELGNPVASKDPAAKNAAVLVRAIGCGEPTQAGITATAEGIVNGERKTIPAKLVALGERGLYAVERSWPKEGKWLLHIRGSYMGRDTSTVAHVLANGEVKRPGKLLQNHVSASEIDAMVRAE